jgi:hypothetical protein
MRRGSVAERDESPARVSARRPAHEKSFTNGTLSDLGRTQYRPLAPALFHSRFAQEIANAPAAYAARGDHAIVADDTPRASAASYALNLTAHGDALQRGLHGASLLAVQFRGVEIGQAHFDPGIGIARLSDAKAVAVADIANGAGKALAGAGRQIAFARVGVSKGWQRQDRQSDAAGSDSHGPQSTWEFVFDSGIEARKAERRTQLDTKHESPGGVSARNPSAASLDGVFDQTSQGCGLARGIAVEALNPTRNNKAQRNRRYDQHSFKFPLRLHPQVSSAIVSE